MNNSGPRRRERLAAAFTAARAVMTTTWNGLSGTGFPTRVDEISAEWLSSILVPVGSELAVTEVKLLGTTEGTTNRARLALSYNRPETGSLPPTIFVKTSPSLRGRALLNVLGMSEREALFYRDLRPDMPVATPESYGAFTDGASARFIILLEDMSQRGAQLNDSRYELTREQADALTDALAVLHAASWDNPRSQHRWLDPVDGGTYANWFRIFSPAMLRLGVRRYGDIVTGRWRHAPAVEEMFWRQLDSDMHGPTTVLHGDAHAGNIYFDSQGLPGFYDWQLVRQGSWAYDVGYCLTSVLTIDQRRMWERVLLARYLHRLKENGVTTGPNEQEAWRLLRRQSAYGFVAWLQTLAVGGFHDRDICIEQVRRFATAGEDHEIFTDRSVWI